MENEIYRPVHRIRFVTASSLFDGHDAAINIMRRMLQASGAEVIHLGHNRSASEVVTAALQEDVQAIAISSYQGGHIEYFKYVVELLKQQGAEHIRIFGGGGGVILADEIAELEAYGVTKIYSPDDGRRLGLQGMINEMLRLSDYAVTSQPPLEEFFLRAGRIGALARVITFAEEMVSTDPAKQPERQMFDQFISRLSVGELEKRPAPVIGITGTGGAGKSSLTDELIRRFLIDFADLQIAVLSTDPSKQKTGGALLGDRIRMNSVTHPRVYMRSLATRRAGVELSEAMQDAIRSVKAAGFDLILVETSGIGQGDAAVAGISDVSIYVMTAEFGAPSQLEKIDMLDYADLVVINKFDRKGSEDALRDVQKQYQRNHRRFGEPVEKMPVYGTIASQFNDAGTNRFYAALLQLLQNRFDAERFKGKHLFQTCGRQNNPVIPPDRSHYLREIVKTVSDYHTWVCEQSETARKLYQVKGAAAIASDEAANRILQSHAEELDRALHPDCKQVLNTWEQTLALYQQDEYVARISGQEIRTQLYTKSLSGLRIPKVALPRFRDLGDILTWCLLENRPGEFPFTAGVFPFKREGEDPKRQFAGEGTPERTNRRFHFLSQNERAKRLSTAFDSVTLYGEDPDYPPDIFGKIGESGVSVCTLDDMKKLYAGFDLCDPATSVSMTINGPAPILLAMYMNTAMDQQIQRFQEQTGQQPTEAEREEIEAYTLKNIRGTVQADILKEDQGQNTCIFSTEFALRMMGDVQQYFIDHGVRNYYSVSISGYHIAEAGANPISQLAFTLANAFTYVEYYLSRGMKIDDFAPNLSFFFSNGMDPEYTVMGRVARRIWAIVIRNLYGGNERSQKLKYHIQTSGRSLHAQEIDFNDIRTTLQALLAIYDNCNSLHTNAYDEAITTPSEESVRRAMAIQLIIGKEFGLAKNENPLQGSFIIDELTDLVEQAVLGEFSRISDRGGVLGAMETQYQRGRIQEESLYYETLKHSGALPIIGVNTFLAPASLAEDSVQPKIQLARASYQEKELQIHNLQQFQRRHSAERKTVLIRLQDTATKGGNLFAELMNTVKYCSLGQITKALYQVGGQYRRNV